MDDQQPIVGILVKHALRQPLEEDEKRLLEEWRAKSSRHRLLTEQLQNPRWVEEQWKQQESAPTAEMWADIRRYIDETGEPGPVVVMDQRWRPWYLWASVAVLLGAVIMVGILRSRNYIYNARTAGSREASRHELTPASGSDACRIKWPDGSWAWLKKGSTLDYPDDLRSGEVRLVGEAWFNIAHNAAGPVRIILPDGGQIVVLGTSFDVRASAISSSVYLMTGKVRVVKGLDSVLLSPGAQAVTDSQGVRKSVGANDGTLAWLRPDTKDLYFNFTNVDLSVMLPEIAGWYGVQISNPGELRGVPVTGRVSRGVSLATMVGDLQLFERGHAHIELKEDTILVVP